MNVPRVVLFEGDLLITGTSGKDRIAVSMNLARTRVLVRINRVLAGTFPLSDVTGRLVINALDGNDTVTVAATVPVGADISGGAGRDRLTGGRGHDRIDGGADNDTVNGGVGNDTLVASPGRDVLTGAAGSDTVRGPDAGGTWLVTGTGTGRLNGETRFAKVENLSGGAGADTFDFRRLGLVAGTVDGGTGVDTLTYSTLTEGVRVSLAGGFASKAGGVAGIDNVVGGAGADVLVGTTGACWAGTAGGTSWSAGMGPRAVRQDRDDLLSGGRTRRIGHATSLDSGGG